MIGRVSDVPLSNDPASRYLPWTVGLLVFLATLALAIAMVLSTAGDVWRQNLSGTLTVQVPPIAADTDLDARVGRALDLLRETPGVVSAQRLSAQRMAELMEPWLGTEAGNVELPMPALIDVSVGDGEAIDIEALSIRLAEVAPGTSVDDHAIWLRRLSEFASVAETVSFGVIVVILLSAVSTVVFTTRTGLAIHRDVVEVLHLIGAQDSYVARQFQVYAFRLSAAGAVVGFAGAVVAIYALQLNGDGIGGGLLPDFSLSIVQWAVLAALPVAATLLVVFTVGKTVTRTLAKML